MYKLCKKGIEEYLEELYRILLTGSEQPLSDFEYVYRRIEAIYDFFLFVKPLLVKAPKQLYQQIILEHIGRLPKESMLYQTASVIFTRKSDSEWTSHERLRKDGMGLFQQHNCWSVYTKCNTNRDGEENDNKIGTISIGQDENTSDAEWINHHRRSGKKVVSESGTTYGEKDSAAVWKHVCLRAVINVRQVNGLRVLSTSNDGVLFATSTIEGTINIFDTFTANKMSALSNMGSVMCLAFQPRNNKSENLVISTLNMGENQIIRYSIQAGKADAVIAGRTKGLSHSVNNIGFIMNPFELISSTVYGLSMNGALNIWDLDTSSFVRSFLPDLDDSKVPSSGCACTSIDGRFIFFGIRTIRIVDAPKLTEIWSRKLFSESMQELQNHCITRIKCTDDSEFLFIISNPADSPPKSSTDTSESRTIIQKLNLITKTAYIIAKIPDIVKDISLSQDSKMIAIATNGSIKILSTENAMVMASQQLASIPMSVSFIKDLQSEDDKAKYYKRKTAWDGTTDSHEYSDSNDALNNSVSNFYRLACGSRNGEIHIFGFQKSIESSARSPIWASSFTPDGKYLITVGGSLSNNHSGLYNSPHSESMNSLISTARAEISTSIEKLPQDELAKYKFAIPKLHFDDSMNVDSSVQSGRKSLTSRRRSQTDSLRTSNIAERKISTVGELNMDRKAYSSARRHSIQVDGSRKHQPQLSVDKKLIVGSKTLTDEHKFESKQSLTVTGTDTFGGPVLNMMDMSSSRNNSKVHKRSVSVGNHSHSNSVNNQNAEAGLIDESANERVDSIESQKNFLNNPFESSRRPSLLLSASEDSDNNIKGGAMEQLQPADHTTYHRRASISFGTNTSISGSSAIVGQLNQDDETGSNISKKKDPSYARRKSISMVSQENSATAGVPNTLNKRLSAVNINSMVISSQSNMKKSPSILNNKKGSVINIKGGESRSNVFEDLISNAAPLEMSNITVESNSNPLVLWDVGTGSKMIEIAENDGIIWCDVYVDAYKYIDSIITGDRKGLVKLWGWKSMVSVVGGKILKPKVGNKYARFDMASFNVKMGGTEYEVTGYSLNKEQQVLGMIMKV
jgi:hypothetical protein